MENRARFHEINLTEKVIFKLSMTTICTIIGNIYLVILFILKEESYTLPKLWITINIFIILILGGILIRKLSLNYQTILAGGFFTFLLFPLFWLLLPIKFPQDYIGLRKTDETGLIVAEEYCNKDCNMTRKLIAQDFYEERKFYSWRYAELLGRFPSDDFCCHNRPFNNKYCFGILILLELTFEYLPIIVILTLLVTIFEYYKRKDLSSFSKDFVSKDDFDIRKINAIGLILIVIMVLYNVGYMKSI